MGIDFLGGPYIELGFPLGGVERHHLMELRPDGGGSVFDQDYRRRLWQKYQPKQRIKPVEWTPKFLDP